MKPIVLIAMVLALECCTAVPCGNRTKREQPDIVGIATQVGLQAAATAMEAIQNGAAVKQSFSVQGPGGIGFSKDFAVGGGEAFSKAIGRSRRDVNGIYLPDYNTVIRRGKRQSEQRPSKPPGGMEPQEGMPKSMLNRGREQAQRGAENMSNAGSPRPQ